MPLFNPAQFLLSTSEYLEFVKTKGLQLSAFQIAYSAAKAPASFMEKKKNNQNFNENEPHKNALWREFCFCLLILQDTVKLQPFTLSITVKLKPALVQEVEQAR